LAESLAESIPRFRDSRKKGAVMTGFLGSFLRRQEKRLECPRKGSFAPQVAGVPNDAVPIQPALSAPRTELPALEGDWEVVGDALPSTAGQTGSTEGATGRVPWDADRAVALVAEVDRLIETEVARSATANTEARRRVLRNDGAIVRRLQQARDSSLWAWPEATLHLLARWAAWDRGRTV
jgi:hypothetical protein